LCKRVIQEQCLLLDEAENEAPEEANAAAAATAAAAELDVVMNDAIDSEEASRAASELCKRVIQEQCLLLDEAEYDSPEGANVAAAAAAAAAELAEVANDAMESEEASRAASELCRRLIQEQCLLLDEAENETPADVAVYPIQEEPRLVQKYLALRNEREEDGYDNDGAPAAVKDFQILNSSMPSCQKCSGEGLRGLLGRRGFGLFTRQCRHCVAERAIASQ